MIQNRSLLRRSLKKGNFKNFMSGGLPENGSCLARWVPRRVIEYSESHSSVLVVPSILMVLCISRGASSPQSRAAWWSKRESGHLPVCFEIPQARRRRKCSGRRGAVLPWKAPPSGATGKLDLFAGAIRGCKGRSLTVLIHRLACIKSLVTRVASGFSGSCNLVFILQVIILDGMFQDNIEDLGLKKSAHPVFPVPPEFGKWWALRSEWLPPCSG